MDSKEKYNQVVFLETIKTGRAPKRSGLGSRLYLLAGFTGPILCNSKKNVQPNKKIRDSKVSEYTSRLEFYKNIWTPMGIHGKVVENLMSNNMKNVLTKYLGSHYLVNGSAYFYVYYKPDVVINWGQLDEDLRIMYPTKCRIDKRGFIYYKYS